MKKKERDQTTCKWCNKKTYMTYTKECDSCWELRHRIESNYSLAKKMIKQLNTEEN